LRQLPSQRVNHSLELSLHLGGVRLVDDGTHQGCHPRLLGLGHLGQEIPQARGCDTAARWTLATSPRSPRRGHGAHLTITSTTPVKPTCHERAPASEPAGRILAGGDRDAEDLSDVPSAFTPVTTSTWTLTVLPASRTLTTRASAQHDRVGAAVWGTGAKGLHLRIEAVGHRARSGTSSAS